MRPPRKPNVRVLLLMDVGGSMDPHSELVSQLFSAAKRASNFRELKTLLLPQLRLRQGLRDRVVPRAACRVHDFFSHCTREWKLVIVGDAAMHPSELLGGGDWYGTRSDGGESMAGIRWMQLLADHFDRSAWLNPEPPTYWKGGTAEMLASVFPMYHLTLEGLGEAMAHLSKGPMRKR